MEETEVARLYFVLMADGRAEKRNEAAARLHQLPWSDGRKLAAAGSQVARVLGGEADSKTLEGVYKTLCSLQITSYSARLIEATGQVLITKALELPPENKRRPELLGHGLKILGRAQNAGFPLSDYGVGLAKRAKEADPKNSALADEIIRRNSFLKPERLDTSAFPKAGPPSKKGGRKRVSVH